MHGAPSVSYPVGRSLFAGVALLLAWCSGAAGLLAWRAQVDAQPLAVLAAVAAVTIPGAAALRAWLSSPRGILTWDGSEWTWTEPATSETGSPEPVLDFQRWMLVRWLGDGRTRWLWLEGGVGTPEWARLRRAVYSRARPEPPGTVADGEARP